MRIGQTFRTACTLLALCGAAAHGQQMSPPSPAEDRVMPLEVVINGAKTGTWVLVERAGQLYAPADAFEEWRVTITPDTPSITYRNQRYLALAGIPGFRSKLDSINQSLELLFSPQVFSTLRLTRELDKRPVRSPVLPSVFLNYDVSYTQSHPREARRTRDLGALFEAGVSGPWGVVVSSGFARNLAGDDQLGPPRRSARLETTYTYDFPERNQTLRVGDTATRAAMWGRDVYYGGVRFGSNFALTPGFVSQPLPALGGVSQAPSTVELYVNDVLRQVSSVPTGPFVIDNFPQLTGNGEARIVVRDLLGRETVVVQPFFVSSLLLAKGLTDWSVEAGKVRRDLGVESGNYTDGFASGTWRYGESNERTYEARAEVSRRHKLLGAGMLTVLPWHVLAKAALVGSEDRNLGSGGHWLVGLEKQDLYGGFSIQMSRSTPNFRELGHDDTLVPIRYQIAGNLLYAWEPYGTFGLGFASIARYDRTRITTVSGNYSMRLFQKGNLTLTASKAIDGGSGSSIAMTVLMPLDGGIVASGTVGKRGGTEDAYVTAVKNPGTASDFGWRVLAGQQQGEGRGEAGAYYQGQHGSLAFDATAASSLRAARIGATGGIVAAAGNVFATRRVDESFAVAVVEGYADVPVGLSGNLLSKTDSKGVALVPRLLPYMNNSLRLDPKSLPISAEIENIEQIVVPSWRSGVKVDFPVRSGRGALLKIVFEDGGEAPPGALVGIAGDTEEFYVARRGESFVTGIKPDSRIRLRWKGKECPLDVKLPPENENEIPRVGPITCRGVPR